jgi:nucleotide-binding universal stress UspA family protein
MSADVRAILASVDRDGRMARRVAAKAVRLAHLTGAHLELFLCDAERAFNRKHQYDPQAAARAEELCLCESRRYLEELRRRLSVHDGDISLSVACESPLYEGIVHAVARDHPDLVVRGVAAESRTGADDPDDAEGGILPAATASRVASLGANDWELVHACPVSLLLTRGKRWKAKPLIAAAVDVSPGESRELTREMLRMAGYFARLAGGSVDILHAGRFEAAGSDALDWRRAALADRAREAGLEGADIHLIIGEPAAALADFAAHRGFDLIVIGALTHRKTLTALVGTLTGRLIEALDTDFLLVKPPQFSQDASRVSAT